MTAEAATVKPVVFIGGAPGTGKSTLAGALSARLGLDHRIGTGFIRAVVQSESSAAVERDLFSRTFEADDPVAHLEWQSRRLRSAVMTCVERARREGTSLVVEGTHLPPALYSDGGPDAFFVLAAPPAAAHFARLTGPTHSRRPISERDWRNVQQLDAYYRQEARRHGVPCVVYDDLEPILLLLEGSLSERRVRP